MSQKKNEFDTNILYNKQTNTALMELRDVINNIAKKFSNILESDGFKDFLIFISHYQTESQLEKLDWVPHYTMPHEIFPTILENPELATKSLIEFYNENWDKTSDTIRKNLSKAKADKITTEVFEEAFVAYKYGLHRCVCRLLFPEIERLARDAPLARSTSLQEFKKFINESPVTAVVPEGYFSITIYNLLDNYFYENINTKETLEAFSKRKIPNRHAAIHALIDYNTPQHSLNTIFLADFLVQFIMKAQKSKQGFAA